MASDRAETISRGIGRAAALYLDFATYSRDTEELVRDRERRKAAKEAAEMADAQTDEIMKPINERMDALDNERIELGHRAAEAETPEERAKILERSHAIVKEQLILREQAARNQNEVLSNLMEETAGLGEYGQWVSGQYATQLNNYNMQTQNMVDGYAAQIDRARGRLQQHIDSDREYELSLADDARADRQLDETVRQRDEAGEREDRRLELEGQRVGIERDRLTAAQESDETTRRRADEQEWFQYGEEFADTPAGQEQISMLLDNGHFETRAEARQYVIRAGSSFRAQQMGHDVQPPQLPSSGSAETDQASAEGLAGSLGRSVGEAVTQGRGSPGAVVGGTIADTLTGPAKRFVSGVLGGLGLGGDEEESPQTTETGRGRDRPGRSVPSSVPRESSEPVRDVAPYRGLPEDEAQGTVTGIGDPRREAAPDRPRRELQSPNMPDEDPFATEPEEPKRPTPRGGGAPSRSRRGAPEPTARRTEPEAQTPEEIALLDEERNETEKELAEADPKDKRRTERLRTRLARLDKLRDSIMKRVA